MGSRATATVARSSHRVNVVVSESEIRPKRQRLVIITGKYIREIKEFRSSCRLGTQAVFFIS